MVWVEGCIVVVVVSCIIIVVVIVVENRTYVKKNRMLLCWLFDKNVLTIKYLSVHKPSLTVFLSFCLSVLIRQKSTQNDTVWLVSVPTWSFTQISLLVSAGFFFREKSVKFPMILPDLSTTKLIGLTLLLCMSIWCVLWQSDLWVMSRWIKHLTQKQQQQSM